MIQWNKVVCICTHKHTYKYKHITVIWFLQKFKESCLVVDGQKICVLVINLS